MTNLKALQLKGLKNLDSLEWIKSMPNLVELDLRGTAITDLSLLNTYATKLETLLIDNEGINLTEIQTTINRLGDSEYTKTLLTIWSTKRKSGLHISNQNLANKLKESDSNITIVGYADKNTGTHERNMELSEARANSVANELIKLGINPDNINVVGKGATEQLFDENGANRVVIFVTE